MCLITTGKEHKAKDDIVVYKAVLYNPELRKWMGVYRYSEKLFPLDGLAKESSRKCVLSDIEGYCIEGGYFHSCGTPAGAYEHAMAVILKERFVKGFCVKVFGCTIPKGTPVYEGKDMYGRVYASRGIIVHSGKEFFEGGLDWFGSDGNMWNN